MTEGSAIFNYLKECYKIDTRTVNLTNFFSRKVENRYIIEGKDELLDGHMPDYPLKDRIADRIQDNLDRYPKEKSLYAFAHFVIGEINGKRVCAPLFFIPAKIVYEKSFSYLRLDFKRKFLNLNFLNQIKSERIDSIQELFGDVLEMPVLDFGAASSLVNLLEKPPFQIKADGLLMYPELIAESKLQRKRSKRNFTAVSGLGIGVLKHSSKTLGIISELEELAASKVISKSLEAVLRSNVSQLKVDDPAVHVPAVLSSAQKKVLSNADKYHFSTVIGPPGTGKSFTIANMALDRLQKGESVLIVSKTDEAVDVVHQKLMDSGFGMAAVRAGKSIYLKELKLRIQNILSDQGRRRPMFGELKILLREIEKHKGQIKSWKREFNNDIRKELSWGEFLFEKGDKSGIINSFKKKYISWKNRKQTPLWRNVNVVCRKENKQVDLIAEYILKVYEFQLSELLKNDRKELVTFLKAIRARTLAKQESLFRQLNFTKLLTAFPIWLCNLSDLYEVLPLRADLFDHVIIDEASQCDLASVLPAIQRAKKVTVVGDQNQLRHFSFVSRADQQKLIERFKVSEKLHHLTDYRGSSFLDVCFEKSDSNDQVSFLNEHFRGNGQLINFSNNQFYSGRLSVMKSLPIHNHRSVRFEHCEGGLREKNGTNKAEAEKVIALIKSFAESNHKPVSIGVLSPFRKQAEFLETELLRELDPALFTNHRIMIGTPYSFQGNERDIVIVSWSIDDESSGSTMTYLNTPEVFNVAVTRARNKMIHCLSTDVKNISKGSLLARYIEDVKKFSNEKEEEDRIRDEFLQEVLAFLDNSVKNIESIHTDYAVASIPVDILIECQGKYKAIDLIGYPGRFAESIDLNQYQLLNRAGVEVLPLPYSYWMFVADRCKPELIHFLEE